MTVPTVVRAAAGALRSRARHLVVLAVLAPLLSFGLVTAAAPAPEAAAQQRRVVVIGDSIILGARPALIGAFEGAGWQIVVDAEVSRSTLAAVDAIEAHRAELTDSLVLSFGANDAGNPATFRARVERVLAAAASVPHVYWLTIREVRDYYPAANQVLREVAAAHPNVTVVDWNAATAGTEGLTAGDGLHLTGAGAGRMAEVLVGSVVNGAAPPAAPPAAVAAPPPPPVTEPVPVETTAAPAPAPTEAPPGETTAVPTTVETTVAPTTTTVPADDRDERASELTEAEDTSSVDLGDAAGWTAAGGLALVLALLVFGGLGLSAWSLGTTRGRRPEQVEPSPQHPAVRARRRAELIAAATRQADDPTHASSSGTGPDEDSDP